jgi:hypothetical protein
LQKHRRIKTECKRAYPSVVKPHGRTQESMQGMWVSHLQSTENARVTARNAVDQISAKTWNLSMKIPSKKAEDFAPVALFIHFQMNLVEISRPRKHGSQSLKTEFHLVSR